MKFKDLTPGTVLRRKAEPAWTNEFNKVRVLDTIQEKDLEYVWIRYVLAGGADGQLDTLSYGNIKSNWEIVLPFYKLGKKYRFKNGRRDVYEIIELHLVERAISDDHREVALAKCHDQYSGKVYLTVLNKSNYDQMQEV